MVRILQYGQFVLLILWFFAVIFLGSILTFVGGLWGVANKAANTPAVLMDRALDPANIENAYHKFRDEKLEYQARLSQIKTSESDLADAQKNNDKDETYRLRTELRGQQQNCRDIAAGYNADSLKADQNLFKDPMFLSNHMPKTIDMDACGE